MIVYSASDLRRLRLAAIGVRHFLPAAACDVIISLGLRARKRGRRAGRRFNCSAPFTTQAVIDVCQQGSGEDHADQLLPAVNLNNVDSSGCSLPVRVSDSNRRPPRRPSCSRQRVLTNVSATPCRALVSQHQAPLIFILNTCSIVKPHAFDQLKSDIVDLNPDVVVLTETHMNSRHPSELFSFPGYIFFRKDRCKRKGGGICVLVRDTLKPNRLQESFLLDNTECLWLRFWFKDQSFLLCSCYHPPKPIYSAVELVNILDNNIESLLHVQDVGFILTGDLNKLNVKQLEVKHGLLQLVSQGTRRNNILDVFYTTRPDLFCADVFVSSVKTDHKAVVVNWDKNPSNVDMSVDCSKSNRTVVYDLSPRYLLKLSETLKTYNWSAFTLALELCQSDEDLSNIYQDFVTVVKLLINFDNPGKSVAFSDRDPSFITPRIKILLRQRNKLRRQGKVVQANEISDKVGKLIAKNRSKALSKVTNQDTRKLWSAVNTNGRRGGKPSCTIPFQANELNEYFAKIATDPNYSKDAVLGSVANFFSKDNGVSFCEWSENTVCIVLSKIKHSAPGFDDIPSWFYKLFASEVSPIVCKIISTSVSRGLVPITWKQAVVTPVPKCSLVRQPGDFRPISVTSLLCRQVEKLVARTYILPKLYDSMYSDQYAFKHTGSTTAALVDITYKVSMLLEKNEYVRCVLVDFSKAFDTVDHSQLVNKLSQLDLPH
jgi:hypothetical protein